MWRLPLALLLGSGCTGGAAYVGTAEPTSYFTEALYASGAYETPAPPTLSDDGTLVTWWYQPPGMYSSPSGYFAVTWDVETGERLGATNLYADLTMDGQGMPIAGPPVMSAIGDDGYLLHAGGGFLAANDPVGNPHWTVPIGTMASTSVAVADDGSVIIGDHGGALQAFEPNGDPRWGVTLPAPAFGHPVLDRDGAVWVTVKYADGVWGLVGVRDGAVDVEVPADEVIASPALGEDGNVYVAVHVGSTPLQEAPPADFLLRAYAPDGAVAWEAPTDGPASSPIVDPDGTVYVAAQPIGQPGHLMALSDRDGREKWLEPLEGDVWQPALLDDGTIVAGCGSALCGYDKNGGNEVFAWPSTESVTGVWGPPLARDGVIVAITSYGYYAWESGKRVNTEPKGWSRLGGDDRMTGAGR